MKKEYKMPETLELPVRVETSICDSQFKASTHDSFIEEDDFEW